MLTAYPRDFNVDQSLLVRCREACYDCAQACTQCADDCLSERGRVEELAKCIRLDLDCADVCAATGRVVSRQTEYDANVTRAVLQACIAACRACGDECATHEGMDHCGLCAEQCRACERACEALLHAIS
ncbi:MAG: four-helix bundle copper-binding protein [Thermoleophilia bacterium]|nr:four-helix bundle copper-binding protein [Thermoleophilia bacterium]